MRGLLPQRVEIYHADFQFSVCRTERRSHAKQPAIKVIASFERNRVITL